MDSRELSEWAQYYAIEPWGEERSDLRTGIVASTMVNLQLKPEAKPTTPAMFIPEFGPRDRAAERVQQRKRELEQSRRLSEQLRAAFGAMRTTNERSGPTHP